MNNRQMSCASPVAQSRTAERRALQAALILLGFCWSVFWWQDVRYALPATLTGGPEEESRSETTFHAAVSGLIPSGNIQPVLLHFYDQDCACCLFNQEHMAELARDFHDKAVMIVVTKGPAENGRFRRPGLDLPAIADADGAIAASFGVRSTPQAVILNAEGRRLFRGNYNVSRFCADRRTSFVRNALEAVCNGRDNPPCAPERQGDFGCPLRASTEESH